MELIQLKAGAEATLDHEPIRPDIQAYAKIAARRLGPVSLRVEITSRCEQACVFCDSWRPTAPHGAFTADQLFARVIEPFFSFETAESIGFTGGDPRSHPEWLDFCRRLAVFKEERQKTGRPTKFTAISAFATPMREGEADGMRAAFDEVRFSLDGVTPEVYRKTRGVLMDPEEIIGRVETLDHPNLQVATCASRHNMDHIPEIFARVATSALRVRKLVVMPTMGQHDRKKNADPDGYWARFQQMRNLALPIAKEAGLQTNLDGWSEKENPEYVPTLLASGKYDHVRCWSSILSGHVKATGDVFPCCLVGGESIETQRGMVIGNVHTETFADIWRRWAAQPPPEFFKGDGFCRRGCQWKQFHVNLAGEQATTVGLTIP